MRKHKKTRKEKIIADLRRSLQTQATGQTFSFAPQKIIIKKAVLPQTYAITTNSYPYLTHDLLKTFTLTGVIITSQLLLLYFLKIHLIKIPNLIY